MIWRRVGIVVGIIIVVGAAGVFAVTRAPKVDLERPPQFIQAEFIELDKIGAISKFRSGTGHDFSGGSETCRSMKHYLKPIYDPTDPAAYPKGNGDNLPPPPTPETEIAIMSPVDGVIEDVSDEQTPIGQQVRIKPTNQPKFRVRLFHVYLDEGVKRGTKVTAGQRIGAIAKGSGTDIAIQAGPMPWQETFVSYFAVLPDALFAAYEKRGVASRDQLIISRAERDANPLQCEGETFKHPDGYDHDADEVRLNGYVDGRFQRGPQGGSSSASSTSGESRQEASHSRGDPGGTQPTASSTAEPPMRIKHLGLELAPYDAATGMAGDLKFIATKVMFDRLFTGFGFVIPAGQTSSGNDKANPQPTFLAPMGTKVRSLVDGVVTGVPELYSHDYSIQVASDAKSPWIYETEHVTNPLVKVGDRVTAGQVIAEVSPHNKDGSSGLGMVEIGILKGGNPPSHVCPFQYLDPSIKDQLLGQLTQLFKDWEAFRSDSNLYDEREPIPGCRTLDPIAG